MFILSKYYVVKQLHIQKPECVLDILRLFPVRHAWSGIPGRMVVYKDYTCRSVSSAYLAMILMSITEESMPPWLIFAQPMV